jgi:translation initiation factor IF-3
MDQLLWKTDIYIEKSVKLVSINEYSPINSLIDFGKFIFKEKNTKNKWKQSTIFQHPRLNETAASTNRIKVGELFKILREKY